MVFISPDHKAGYFWGMVQGGGAGVWSVMNGKSVGDVSWIPSKIGWAHGRSNFLLGCCLLLTPWGACFCVSFWLSFKTNHHQIDRRTESNSGILTSPAKMYQPMPACCHFHWFFASASQSLNSGMIWRNHFFKSSIENYSFVIKRLGLTGTSELASNDVNSVQNPGWLFDIGYIGDDSLPNYIGIIL